MQGKSGNDEFYNSKLTFRFSVFSFSRLGSKKATHGTEGRRRNALGNQLVTRVTESVREGEREREREREREVRKKRGERKFFENKNFVWWDK